jgi:hypothetical protein
MTRLFMAGAVALLTSGCVDTAGSLQTRPVIAAKAPSAPAPNTPATLQTQQIFSRAASQAGDEEIVTAYVPQTGNVRGTRAALASLGSPLRPAPGRNRTVQACREAVQSEAMRLGAHKVEAASAGPDRRNDKGQFVGPVRMRITYARATSYEVRLANMTCIVDAEGKIVDAFV